MPQIAVTIAGPAPSGWTARGDDGSTWLVPTDALASLRTLRAGQRLVAFTDGERVTSVRIGPVEVSQPS